MRTLISTLVLLLLLGGAALADQAESAPPAPRAIAGTMGDASAPPSAVDKVDSPSLGSHLLSFIKVRVSLWLGIDLFGGSDEPGGPQRDDGKHVGRQLIIPITRDGGWEEQM